MKKKQKKQNEQRLTTGQVILRIMKDSLSILHWLLLATVLSIGSAYLAMRAPEVLGDLTNQIYDLANAGIAMDMAIFCNRIAFLQRVPRLMMTSRGFHLSYAIPRASEARSTRNTPCRTSAFALRLWNFTACRSRKCFRARASYPPASTPTPKPTSLLLSNSLDLSRITITTAASSRCAP